jgi:hypothetical protein
MGLIPRFRQSFIQALFPLSLANQACLMAAQPASTNEGGRAI